jgi:hypothetical protein
VPGGIDDFSLTEELNPIADRLPMSQNPPTIDPDAMNTAFPI